MSKLKLVVFNDLGLIGYKEAWDIQEKIFSEVIDKKISNRKKPLSQKQRTSDYLLFAEHKPVFTLGKSGDMNNLLTEVSQLENLGIEFFKINRGGDITFHGPGQIVGYPILNLDHFYTDIHRYLRTLEDVIIDTLAEYGIKGGRSPGETGVWLDEGTPFARKICALGVRASRWVTMHGWAFNVNTDLKYFQHIVPCGISDKAVTSLSAETGKQMNMVEVKQKIKMHFEKRFDVRLEDFSQ